MVQMMLQEMIFMPMNLWQKQFCEPMRVVWIFPNMTTMVMVLWMVCMLFMPERVKQQVV